jgi:hypothetical protein
MEVLRALILAFTLKNGIFLPSAPLAGDMSAAHLLLNSDLDSSAAKNSFLFLSHPRTYDDGMAA